MGCPNLFACKDHTLSLIFDSPVVPIWLDGVFVNGDPSHNFYVCKGSGMLIMDCGPVWIGSHANDILPHLKQTAEYSQIASAT